MTVNSIVTIPYQNLEQTVELSKKVEQAFGDKGLGALVVTDIPDELVQLKNKIYKLGYQLGKLPEDKLERM